MPCQEFCGVGHEGMWARVKVIDKAEFMKLSAGRRRMSCAD
jgi:cytochrome c oxidase subunit 2